MTAPRRRARVILAAGALLAAAATPASAQDVLVVAPAELQPALADWKAHRIEQGLRVAVREPALDLAAAVREAHAASGGRLRSVLLLGDVHRIPCAYVPVVATAKWEKDTRIATDAPFADVDGDGVPDLAIGRVPADSADEARALLGRSLAYERSTDFGPWRRRLNVVAGVGGFGPLQDAAIETMSKQLLTRQVPPAYVVTGTYGNPLSAWCPPPEEFAATVVERFNEGALVLTYLGHGSADHLDDVRVGRDRYPILGPAEVGRIDVRAGAPLVVFVACTTGRFDAERDCLAEEVLKRPRGPVAVIASSRVSTPYSNGVLSRELLAGLFSEPAATAGELLLGMKRRLVASREDDAERRQIDTFAASFFDADPGRRAADRREHVALYNLLGDPCLRIGRPAAMELDAPASVVAGRPLEVRGTAPEAGRLVVELVRRRDTFTPIGSRRTPEEWRATYLAANSLEVARKETDVQAGAFRVVLEPPADARGGPCCVRAYLEGRSVGAAGGRAIDLAQAPAPSEGR